MKIRTFSILTLGIICLPFSSSIESGVVFHYSLIVIAGFVFLYFLLKPIKRINSLVLIPALVGAMPIYTSFIAPKIGSSMLRAIPYFLFFCLFIILISEIKKKFSTLNYARKLIVNLCIVLSGYYIFNFILKSLDYGFSNVIVERMIGGKAALPWGASNTISATLLVGIIVLYMPPTIYSLKEKIRKETLGILFISSGILLTLSRTTTILLIATWLMSLLFKIKSPRALIKPLVFTSFFLITVWLSSQYWKQVEPVSYKVIFNSRFSHENNITLGGRSEINSHFFNYLINNPFSMVGYYGMLPSFGKSCHNYFLTTCIEQSFLGLFISILFFALPFILEMRIKEKKNRIVRIWKLFGILIIATNLSFEDVQYTIPYVCVFWIYFSLVYGEYFYLIAQKREKRGLNSYS